MNRRTFVIGVGGIGAAAVGSFALAGGAAAETSGGMDGLSDEEFDTNSGRMEAITLTISGLYAEWDGLEAPAEAVTWTLAVSKGETTAEIGTITKELSDDPRYEGGVSETDSSGLFGSFDLVDIFGVEAFEVDSEDGYDGEDAIDTFDVEFTLTTEITDIEDATSDDTETGNLNLGITNLADEVDGSLEGEIEGEEESGAAYDSDSSAYDHLTVEESDGSYTFTATDVNSNWSFEFDFSDGADNTQNGSQSPPETVTVTEPQEGSIELKNPGGQTVERWEA